MFQTETRVVADEVNLLKVMEMDGDFVGWMESMISERAVEMIIEGNANDRHPMEAGVEQCSPVSPIIFTLYS